MPEIIYLAQTIDEKTGWYKNQLVTRRVIYGKRRVLSTYTIPREKLDPTWTQFHESEAGDAPKAR